MLSIVSLCWCAFLILPTLLSLLAVGSSEGAGTLAEVLVDAVDTGSTVQARIAVAFIDVSLALGASVSRVT